ncbi:hypothetical protein AAFC00_002535 [Neodothiora populina]
MAGTLYSEHSNRVPAVLAILSLPLVVGYWLSSITEKVANPYLDEFFHVVQAQTYCAGRLREWDPKITTPPGLYLLSYLVHQASGSCGILALRSLNAVLLLFIFIIVLYMSSPSRSRVITSRQASRNTSLLSSIGEVDPQQIHTALNMCLFPPLFFFSGLYYTDVASTLFVLLFFKHFFDIHARGTPTILQAVCSVLLGLIALSFRQTNIFWVAVFPAGLVAISGMGEKRNPSRSSITRSFSVTDATRDVISKTWAEGILYDPQVGGAWIDDYLMNIVSILVLGVRTLTARDKTLRLIRLLLPYLTLLALFGAFVLWNGGVVLGDKSNHIATLHLPQMLYIWPYITFFSIPLTYPFILQGGVAILGMIPVVMVFEPLLIYSRHKILPRPVVTLAIVGLAMLAVHYNTIVHPFTLADNRHYTFYVFRILMRHPIIRYLAAPVYLVTAWAAIQALGASAKFFFTDEDRTRNMDEPGSVNRKVTSLPSRQAVLLNDAAFGEGCTVSFVLIWLLTSALALVTAPLVEPRYFIIPWVMWRLRVPEAHPSGFELGPPRLTVAGPKTKAKAAVENRGFFARVLYLEHDHRLWLETIWFLVVNAVTCWVFLNKGFTWPQEPGNVQRFMW